MRKSNILFLIIYVFVFTSSFSQNVLLKIEGETSKETDIIDSLSYNKKFKDIESFNLEKNAFENKIYRLGYIDSKEVTKTKTNDSTYLITYSLNKLYKAIHIYYDKQLVPREILETVSDELYGDYFSIPFSLVEAKLNDLNQHLANQGSPFKTLQLQNIKKKESDILSATLLISDESKRIINKIVVNGYKKFPKSFLKRYLKIKKNEEFNLTEIKSKTSALNELSFASQIKPPEVLFTEDSTTLYMYLEKRSSNTFDGFLGFGTNENTNKIEFDGYLNLNLINNLNYGESFRLLYKSDENEQKTFEGQIELPYIFGTPIGTELQLNIFKKDSSFTTVNQFAKVFYQLNPKSKLLIGINSTQSNNLLDETATLLVDDYNTTFYNIGYSYLSKESYNSLFPVNFNFYLEAGTGSRVFENNNLKQTNVHFDTFKIFNLNNKNSIYIRTTGSLLFSDNYFFNELYRFGGINSIRGFEENSLFASTYALINTEYRYKLSNSIYINSIIDGAYYENDISASKEKLFGFGFGFGLLTNSGLLKFNYANGKSENQKFKFSDSKIHISLTARF